VTDLPRDAKETEIRDFFSRKIHNYNGDMELKKVCMGYDPNKYNEVLE
jgi:hypothetical protein